MTDGGDHRPDAEADLPRRADPWSVLLGAGLAVGSLASLLAGYLIGRAWP